MSRTLPGYCWTLVALVAVGGCGKRADGPPKIDIRGRVTHNGKPVNDGAIAFYPDGGTTGAPTSGPIKNGAYNLRGRSAIVAGTYRVEVREYKWPAPGSLKDANGFEPPPGMIVPEQLLPDKFNAKSEIEKVVVSDVTKPLTRDYDLKD